MKRSATAIFIPRFTFLGKIRYDEKVHDSIQLRQNFMTKYAYTKSANDLARVARNILAAERNLDLTDENPPDPV